MRGDLSLGWSGVHLHVDMKGRISEKTVLKEGLSFISVVRGTPTCKYKGKVSEKAVLEEG